MPVVSIIIVLKSTFYESGTIWFPSGIFRVLTVSAYDLFSLMTRFRLLLNLFLLVRVPHSVPHRLLIKERLTELSEERLTELIMSIFKEEFEIQQKNIVTLISGNFEITMQEIKKVNNEINELKTSIEHTDEVLQQRMEKIEEKYDHINSKVNEIYVYQMDPQYVEEKLIELEDRLRRCNLKIDGVEEEKDETWDQCEEKVLDIFTSQLGIEKNVQIERAHRTGKKGSKHSHEKTRKPRTSFKVE